MTLIFQKLLIICVLGWLIASCSQASPLILVTLQQPPVQFEEQGKIKGISVDILREVFQRMHQPIDIRLYPFARTLFLARTGGADAIFSIVKTDERESFLIYPDETLLNQEAVMIVRKDDPVQFNGDFSHLSQHTFGVLHAATYGPEYEAAVKAGLIKYFEEVENYQQSTQMLINGRTDVMIGPRLTLLYAVKQLGYNDRIRILSPAIEVVPTYIAFNRSHVEADFIQRFEKTLRAVKQDGTYDRIVQKYID